MIDTSEKMPKAAKRFFTIMLTFIFLDILAITVLTYQENHPAFQLKKHNAERLVPTRVEYIYVEVPQTVPLFEPDFTPEPELTQEQYIQNYILKICELYPYVDPYMIMGQVWAESRYDPNAISISGEHVGLMQVSTRWHADRADRLGVENLFDIYGNLFVGINYMAELIDQTGSPALSLMIYNMGYVEPYKLLDQGIISEYAKQVLAKAEEYRMEFQGM